MDAPDNLYQVTSSEHLQELLSKDLNRVSLLYFWAPWAEPCIQMTKVITELTRKYPEVLSLQIEAEEQSEIAESFDIGSVPLVLLLRVRRLLPPSDFRLRLKNFLTQGPHTSHPHRGCRRRRPHRRPHEPCKTCRGAAFPDRQSPCYWGDNNNVGDARGARSTPVSTHEPVQSRAFHEGLAGRTTLRLFAENMRVAEGARCRVFAL